MICTPFSGQPEKGVIFMRYSYEFKRKCVEMYRQGLLPDTPDGITRKQFRREVRKWTRIEDAQGADA